MSLPMVSADDFGVQLDGHDVVVVKFGAPWCGPCRAMAPMLDQAVGEFPQVRFLEVNVDESPALAARYAIRSLPTLMAWKKGVVQWTRIGAPPMKDLRAALSEL